MSKNIESCVNQRTGKIFQRAAKYCGDTVAKATDLVNEFVTEKLGSTEGLCFAATGSVGRWEALEASDLDLIPIAETSKKLKSWEPYDAELRELLKKKLGIKVSKGEELTKACALPNLVRAEKIGGTEDSSAELTKRVLLLTESVSVGGGMDIGKVRAALLDAYGKEDRTSGRHVLSLCNDVARYYKTLCIEYIPRAVDPQKDWCTRNIKLRHSRKFWYFANIMAVVTLAHAHPHGDKAFKTALLEAFATPPAERLANAIVSDHHHGLSRLLEYYANFLEFMSKSKNRDALAGVAHKDRYDMRPGNPFLAMKFNSDLLHTEVMAVIEELGPSARSRVISWFML